MEASEQRRIVEALILASPEPLGAQALARIVPGSSPSEVKSMIEELNAEYAEQNRAFEIWEVAGGYQIRTRAEFSGYLQQLRRERPLRLSQAALETLSIIAYKQPTSRGELEQVRGVDCGAVVKSLLDRRLLRILGHRDVPGRPLIYGTSKRFLEVFGLSSLKELPELRELEDLAREQGIDIPGAGDLADTSAAESDQLLPENGAEEPVDGDGSGAMSPGDPISEHESDRPLDFLEHEPEEASVESAEDSS